MSDVFDEINDDLRREKLNQFWKENGAWIIGGAIAAVVMTAALTFWRGYQFRHNAQETAALSKLVATSDVKQLESFAAASDKNHAVLARFVAAGVLLGRGGKDQAVTIYDAIADTSGVDKTWRDLARLLSATQRLDKDDPEKLKKELTPLSGDKNAWRFSAREMLALLAARQGKPQEAAGLLAKIIADPNAPPDARTRAQTLHDLYMADVKSAVKTGD